jgi:Beta-ketoacyl synthase, N-terminal domain
MNPLYVNAIGLFAPGLTNWDKSQQILRGDKQYLPAENTKPPVCQFLPANERRRTSTTIKLALQVATEALHLSGHSLSPVKSVFASGSGDMDIVQNNCLALTLPDKPVSPIQFHNSVHNGPAGYWSIAINSHLPTTSLSAYTGSFAAGLLEAYTQLVTEPRPPMLLVAYDIPSPTPLDQARPVFAIFGVALLLQLEASASSLGRISPEIISDSGIETRLNDAKLEVLRLDNPAARSLPLLTCLAKRQNEAITLPYLSDLKLRILYEAPA